MSGWVKNDKDCQNIGNNDDKGLCDKKEKGQYENLSAVHCLRKVSHDVHHVIPSPSHRPSLINFRKEMPSSNIHLHCGQAEFYLPNELLSIIINKLAADTEDNDIALAALASCRLASHVLCSLATPLFFSSIELIEGLDPHDGVVAFNDRVTKLNQLLAQTTYDIAASVHTFTLRFGQVNGTLISEILHRLPHVKHFTLECEEYPFTEDFSSAIEALCRSPYLTTLTFEGVENLPITLVTACHNLRCLRLLYIDFCVNSIFSVFSVIANPIFQFYDMDPMDETSSTQPFYLDSLEIDRYSLCSLGAVSRQSFANHFSQIKNLQLKNITLKALKLGWDIMLLASQSLTTLDLSWDSTCKFRHDIYISAKMYL